MTQLERSAEEKMFLGYLMLDGKTTLRDVAVDPAFIAGAFCLVTCAAWWVVRKKRKDTPRPYLFRALLVCGVGLLAFAVFGTSFFPNTPLW